MFSLTRIYPRHSQQILSLNLFIMILYSYPKAFSKPTFPLTRQNTITYSQNDVKNLQDSHVTVHDQDIQNTDKQRKQVAKIVLNAFQNDFKGVDASVRRVLPFIFPIQAPQTPAEFIQMENAIVGKGDAKYLKEGGFLSPYDLVVPSVNGSAKAKCSLTRYPICARFNKQILNSFMVDLFEAIQNETGKNGVPKIYLDRYDLFHGHFFLDYDGTGVGILFHSKEYPALNQTDFPYNLGYCQKGSWLQYSPTIMNFRNILWYKGKLGVLDVDPRGALRNLVWNLLRPFNTILESDFGDCPADVNFFVQLEEDNSNDKLFIC
eukprot:TRINITY_DN2544_c0_g1_i4.p1 TRINITY_DN2544_c0_g1~~TRINITY_DN2544_c0_g1_i4.p1  ORF type:complete len:320 (+),score=23.04 TRINITY_DN2544_c0_g1_i4:2-961(+)